MKVPFLATVAVNRPALYKFLPACEDHSRSPDNKYHGLNICSPQLTLHQKYYLKVRARNAPWNFLAGYRLPAPCQGPEKGIDLLCKFE